MTTVADTFNQKCSNCKSYWGKRIYWRLSDNPWIGFSSGEVQIFKTQTWFPLISVNKILCVFPVFSLCNFNFPCEFPL